jgi:hypothetical protein
MRTIVMMCMFCVAEFGTEVLLEEAIMCGGGGGPAVIVPISF